MREINLGVKPRFNHEVKFMMKLQETKGSADNYNLSLSTFHQKNYRLSPDSFILCM